MGWSCGHGFRTLVVDIAVAIVILVIVAVVVGTTGLQPGRPTGMDAVVHDGYAELQACVVAMALSKNWRWVSL
jgi:hypothetical protein